LRTRAQKDAQLKELLIEGVGSILEGMNPKLIRTKLEAFAATSAKKNKPKAEKGAVGAAAEAQG
jgi:chemotaxis protein MotA